MKSLNKYFAFSCIALIWIFFGCTSVKQTSRSNLAFLYQPDKQFAKIECAVFHSNDTTSDLFVKINYSDLVYEKDPFSGIYNCHYRISWKMWKGYESGEVLAGGSEISGDSINYGKNAWTVHAFVVPSKNPENYVVEVELYDLHRKAGSKQYVNILKSNRNGRQNFLLFDRNTQLIFRNYLIPGEVFRVITGERDLDKVYISCYWREFLLARPPYLEDREPSFEYRPDSMFALSLSDGNTGWLEFTKRGFYHFRIDTTQKEGFTVFVFEEGFPEIYSAEQLREPLRYITTKKEYDSLMASDQPKGAVDNFWLRTAGSPERALTLIQKYYNNVEESNFYFTSYLEGWKTDRGLIYTVLGKPNYVYRSDATEEWIYGEPQNRSSLMFTFVKVRNPFTDNDYMLLRSPTFKDPWFITVQSWRR